MKQISKDTTFVIRDKEDSKVIVGRVPATVKVMTPEEYDLQLWFSKGPEAGKYETHRAQVLSLLGSQLLQHQGSSATKAKASKYANAKKEDQVKLLEELNGFVYSHSWEKAPGVRSSENKDAAITQLMSLLGLTQEQAEKAYNVSRGKKVEEAEEPDAEEQEG